MTVSGLGVAIMGVVDTLLVSALGTAQLAGVGIGLVVTNGVMAFGFGLLRGVKVLLAQARVRGAHDSAEVYVGAGVLAALLLGAAALLLGECAALVVPRFAASVEAGEAARRYIAVRSLGMPIILVYVALREARYGVGDTRSPLICALSGNVAHALFDVTALYLLGWGAAGAAAANVLAFCVQTALLASVQRDAAFAFGARQRRALFDVVRAGAFTGMHFVLEIASVATLSLLLAGVSDREMAAHQIAVQLAAFCFLPTFAISEAATLLAAEAVGRGRPSSVLTAARAARKLALLYAALCAVVLIGLGGPLAALFTRDAQLAQLARVVFVVCAGNQLVEALSLAGHGVLRGVGASRLSALCALGCAWLLTPWVGYLLIRVLELGAAGAWLARTFELACAAAILWRTIERGSWQVGREVPIAVHSLRESQPSLTG
jgi:MATE family multidrug resistance protein